MSDASIEPTAPTAPVHRTVEVPAEPDDVWELLVDDDERAGWFGGETTLEPTPGGRGWFTDPDGTRRVAVVEEVEPGRRLTWSWTVDGDDGDDTGASRVRIDLTPVPDGTRVSVTESPLVPTAQLSAMTMRSATGATGPTGALDRFGDHAHRLRTLLVGAR